MLPVSNSEAYIKTIVSFNRSIHEAKPGLIRPEPVRQVRDRVLVAVAARIGPTRLIDNFEWERK